MLSVAFMCKYSLLPGSSLNRDARNVVREMKRGFFQISKRNKGEDKNCERKRQQVSSQGHEERPEDTDHLREQKLAMSNTV